MPQRKLDSLFTEYLFTEQEAVAANVLTELQLAKLQTRLAELILQKATMLIPGDAGVDRAYICEIAEIEGKISMIQELFNNHQDALTKINDPNRKDVNISTAQEQFIGSVADRAAQLVNNPNPQE